ncbi:MAG: HAD family phosphatase [Pseudomonadota bacterium]
MTLSAVIFDIGGVLVDWQPHLAWADELSEPDTRTFMARIDFPALNLRADGGETFAALAAALPDPDDARRLAAYPSLYARTVQNAVPGTWAVLDALHAKGVPTHAITNWSAETWPEGVKAHPRLAQVFGTLIVSGREHLLKPDPAIFHLLCTRADVAPETCVFIDDGLHNVDGARAVGMDAIHFTGADALRAALTERGLL